MGKKAEKKDKHFEDSKGSLRHFTRHLDACDYQEGSCDYPRYQSELPSDSNLYQRHHILPIQAITKYKTLDAYTDAERETIDAVYSKTEWCSSRKENLIVLAQKQLLWATGNSKKAINPRIQDVGKRLGEKNFKPIADRPCHNWDHWSAPYCYNDEVTIAFHQKIWQKIKKVAKTKVCTSAEKVKTDIAQLETDFRDELKRRGEREGGTKKGLEASVSTKPPEHWWLPFSMAKDDVAKARRALPIGGGHPKINWESEKKSAEMKAAVNNLLAK